VEDQQSIKRRRWKVKVLIVLGIIAGVPIWYYWLTAVYVAEVPPNEPVRERYFNFLRDSQIRDYFPGSTEKDIRPRNILVVTGRFQGSGAFLYVNLYAVEGGKVTDCGALAAGESSNRIGTVFGESLRIVFALGDLQTSKGRATMIGCVGQTRGGGHSTAALQHVKPVLRTAFRGWVSRSNPQIVYVEGDPPTNVKPSMNIEEFAAANPGKFLVVTMQMK
jgi:hypothetical protein